MSDKELSVGLICFNGETAAGGARRSFVRKLRTNGDDVLQTTVLRIDKNRRASVHDPQRVLQGTLTAALTWGAFGLVAGTNKVESTIIWAVIGAICGGVFAYTSEHLLSKSE